MSSPGPEEEVVFAGDLFVDKSYRKHDFQFGPISQSVDALCAASTDLDMTGQIIWPGASFLSWYLVHVRELLRGQTVLEVGSGAGLCGLLASQWAGEVVLSDGIDEVVELLHSNIDKYSGGARVSAVKLDWGERASHDALLSLYPTRFRIVIGADVLFAFFPNSISLLFAALADVLHPDGVFLSGFVVRNAVYQEQAEAAAAKAGLLIGEADQSYLPSPLPPLVESTLAVLEVKLLVIAWRREAMEPWLLRPQPT